jgi:hypothetical protein
MSIVINWGNTPEEMQKNLHKVKKKVLTELGLKWWIELFPKRFSEKHRTEYGIRSRSKSHEAKKKRKGWANNPLEFTGKLKEASTLKKPSVKVDNEGLKVNFRGLPKYIYYSTVSNEDKTELQKDIETKYQGNIFIAQRELKKKGEVVSLFHLSQVQQGLLTRNKTNLPPMTKELIAVSFKDEKILRDFLIKRYPELINEKTNKKPKKVKLKA